MRPAREALGVWRAALRGLAPDLIPALEGWLQRLAQFLGPYPVPRSSEGDEPQGYLGLEKRGAYERLLASEWAMLMAAPLEFQRRAIAGEQLFFALARERWVASRRCVVLVDSGPEQLGNARLVQMALLTVLAERAKAAGVDFFWSAWQADPGELDTGFEAGSIQRFLELRSGQVLRAAEVAAWLEKLGPAQEGEERWAIGAPGAELEGHRSLARVEIREEEARVVETLEVSWQNPGKSPRSLRLKLPPQIDRVRLLRNPYVDRQTAIGQARPRPNGPTGQVVGASFGFRATKLLVSFGSEIVSFHLEQNFEKGIVRPRVLQLSMWALIAVGNHDGTYFTARFPASGKLMLRRTSKRTDQVSEVHLDNVAVSPWAGTSVFSLALPVPERGKQAWVFVDGQGWAHVWDFESRKLGPGWPGVLGIFHDQGRILALGNAGERALATWTHGGWKVSCMLSDVGAISRACVGHAAVRPGFEPELPTTAFEVGEGVWLVGDQKLRPGQNARVVGVTSEGTPDTEGLLVIEADGRSLAHVGLRFSTLLVKAPSPILGVAVAVESPLIAYWTEGGQIEVFSMLKGKSLTLREEI